MSAQTMPASTVNAGLPPVPWRKMAWVTWRQHRLALAGVVAVFGAAGAYLLITGLSLHHAYATVRACRPASSSACVQLAQNFVAKHVHDVLLTAGLMQAIPVLVGAFVGAPLLAREFETGTFRYAWTQGFGRTRWTVGKLASLAIAVTAAAGAFGALFSWYYQPIISAGGGDSGPLTPTIFDLRGVALPAWTLAAFAIGALAGVLIRRVTPAMFATLAVWCALAFLTGTYLRPHYEAPLRSHSADFPLGGLVSSIGLLKDGKPASLEMINQTLRPVGIQALTPTLFDSGPSSGSNVDPVRYLIRHGYTQLTIYQPASRFWPFQWIEGAWLLALSLLLMWTTVWRVRRRAT
jgi:ABC-2 family transporter protein